MTAARGEDTRHLARPLTTSRLELEVDAHSRSVGEVRHAVTAFLTANHVPLAVVDDIELMASELMTNAVLHPIPSRQPVRVQVGVGAEVTLEVAHRGTIDDLPLVADWRTAPPTHVSGRGLGIVRQLADDVRLRQDGPWAVVTCGRRLPGSGAEG